MELRRIKGLPPYVFAEINESEAAGTASRRRRHRPRVRQPRHPLARGRRREAGRGGPQPAQPPVLLEPRDPQAPPGDRRLVPAAIRRRARPRARGPHDDRGEGGALAPDVGPRRAGRHRARAVAVVPDPPLRPAVRGGRRAHGPPRGPWQRRGRRRRGLLRQPGRGVGVGLAEAARGRSSRSRTTRRRPASTSPRWHGSSTSPASTTWCSCTTSPTPTPPSTATVRPRSSRCRGRPTWPSSSTR